MNFNDFVVLPNNKAKSVKLSARKLHELQMETVALDEERKDMEEKLLQLKENMSKEKKERGHSGGFRWKSGQCGSLNINTITNGTKIRESRLQKVSAGKVKIRVLKDDSFTAPPQPLPPTQASRTALQMTKTNRLKGTVCGQCEFRTAGLMCAECTENYCIGCFAKFHQKGALKLHKMIAIKTDLRTHVSTPDVISSFHKWIDHSLYPSAFSNLIPSPNFKPHPQTHHTFTSRKYDQSPEQGTEDVTKPMFCYPDPSQVLVINQGEEMNRMDEEEIPASLLSGEYSEEESARSFQEALRQWRGAKPGATGEPMSEGAMWIPVRPVSVSAMATQVDLPRDKGAEGRVCGREIGRIPVMVEFMENGLTYLDRLLLKKHRRTPVEPYHSPVGFISGLKSLSNTHSEEETANSLTAQEEDFHHYCASLFAVTASRSCADHPDWITTPQTCLVIEVLDRTDRHINGDFVDVQMTEDNKMVHSILQNSSNGNQTTLTSDSGDKTSSESVDLEEDCSDDEPQKLRHITRRGSRREEQGNLAISHLGDSFVPADAGQVDLQTDEPEQLSETPMVLHSQSAGSGSELLCDLHEFTPLGLDMNSGDADTPGLTQSDPLHTCQTSLSDSNQTEARGPGSSLSSYSKENLQTNQKQTTTSSNRGEMTANELGTSELLASFCPLSRAAQEIIEICDVDQTGCEDPDLDTDTTANTLHILEQELKLLAKETDAKASVFGVGNINSQGQHVSQHLNWGTVSEEQREEEEAAQRDLQSVHLLS